MNRVAISLRKAGLLCLLLTVSTVAYSEEGGWLNQALDIHGFATQSLIYTDENRFFGDSDNVSFEFWEAGINGLWRPLETLQFAMQVVARDAGKTDDGQPRIDYAFADLKLHNSQTSATGIRVGRIVNPYGFYNETRDIASTRPSILLPQSVYFDVNRNFALSSDGIQIYHEFGVEDGDFTFQLGVFEPRTEDPDFEPAIFFGSVPGHLEGASSWLGRLLYERDLGRIRVAFTAAEVNVDYKPGAADPISAGKFHLRPYILSANYNREKWSITAEYTRRTTELEKFGVLPNVEFTGSAYFVQGTYRLAKRWETFLRYDELIWNKDDKDGQEFEALTGLPSYMRYGKDLTTGIRWDVSDSIMLRAEWHHVNGTGWLSLLENKNPNATERNWDLFALTVSFRF